MLDGLTLPELMQRLHVPGLSIAVIRDFKIHWVKAYGVANVESGRPVETNTMFQAASISKPVTAMAAMRLVDEHRLSLDDDINTILKSWHAPGHGVNAAFADEPHLGRRRWVWISGIRSVRAKAHRGSDPGREGALERGCGALRAAAVPGVQILWRRCDHHAACAGGSHREAFRRIHAINSA